MSNEIAVLSAFENNLVIAAEHCEIARKEKNHTIQSLKLAKGLSQLKQALLVPEVLSVIKELMNTPTGFLTDKDPSKKTKNKSTGNWESPQPYPDKVVVECVADAMSKGLTIHNNEFNIISGRMYPAQSGFVRKLAEFKREHKIKANYLPSIPKKTGSAYFCEAVVWWQKVGEDREQETLSWNINAFSEDAALGKVKKRANEWLFNELTGNTWSSSEDFNDFSVEKNSNDIEMPEVQTPKVSKEAIINALGMAADLADLNAKSARIKGSGFEKDPEVIKAYTDKKASFTK